MGIGNPKLGTLNLGRAPKSEFGTELDLDLDLDLNLGSLLVGKAQSEGKNRIMSPEAKMTGASHDFSCRSGMVPVPWSRKLV